MDIVLRINQQDPSLALREPYRFTDGSGCHAILEIQSRGFHARRPFYFVDRPLTDFLHQLLGMARTLKGSATLKPIYEHDFIELELTQHWPTHCAWTSLRVFRALPTPEVRVHH